MKYWIGLIIFSIVSACAAAIFAYSAFIGGAIMGICYAAIYHLGKSDGETL
jgi:hypothetical protein